MSKNNVKILSPEELRYLNNRYAFEINDDMILVKIQNYNRVTAHPLDSTFSLNTKVRKLDITPDAIKIWNEKFKGKWSLFDVQNAINILITTYQTPSSEEIEDQLTRGTAQIKLI